jgi:transcriptional regulator with XRE-family HTH domain
MDTLGQRLKAERKRLGMTQPEFALLGGVEKGTQINYEQDKRSPTAEYLIAVAAVGVDTELILHGVVSERALSDDEIELLSGYRKLDVRGKAGVLGTISGMNAAERKATMVVSGHSNNVVQGNQTVKAPLKLKISTTKKKQ